MNETNELQIFDNEQFGKIRAVEIDGEPWFCLSDVCKPLGLRAYHCKERLKQEGIVTRDTPTNSGIQGMLWVNEGNLYRTIFQSKKPEAEAFTDWVTEEVLPALRRTGTYTTTTAATARATLPEGVSLNGLARLISITRRVMLDAGSTPQDVCSMVKETFAAVGWPVPTAFPKKQLAGQFSLFADGEGARA